MGKSEIPIENFLNDLSHWVGEGFSDLSKFIGSVCQNPPTSKAMIVGTFCLVAFATLTMYGIGLLDWIIHRKKDDSDVHELATAKKFTAWNAGDMVVQITKGEAIALKLIDANYKKKVIENVLIQAIQKVKVEGSDKPKYNTLSKAVVKVVFRKKQNFEDNNIAFSPKVESKLILSEEEPSGQKKRGKGPKVTIMPGNFYRMRTVPWYTPRGLAIRTILSPDQSTALTYRIFIWSFLVSWALTEAYYDRAGYDALQAKLAEKAELHQAGHY